MALNDWYTLGMDETLLRRRVRGLMLVGGLMLPTGCGFPVLALIAPAPLRWIALAMWCAVIIALAVVARRLWLALQRLSAQPGDLAPDSASEQRGV